MSIKKLLIILLISCSILPVAFTTGISLNNYSKKANTLIKEYITNSAILQSKNVRNYFEQLDTDLRVAGSLPNIKEFILASDSKTRPENFDSMFRTVNGILDERAINQKSIRTNAVVNTKGVIIASNDINTIGSKALLADEMKKLSEDETVITQILSSVNFQNGIKYFIVATPLYDKETYIGYIFVAVDLSYFTELAEETSEFKTCSLIIMDSYGDVAASGSSYLTDNINSIKAETNLAEKWNKINFSISPNGLIEYNIENEKRIGYYSVISEGGWTILSVAKWSELTAPLSQTVTYTLVFLLEIFILAIGIYFVIVKYFSNPIQSLSRSIHRIQEGEYTTRFTYDKQNEFGEIAGAFNKLIDTIVKNTEKLKLSNLNLETLNANIPGGVCKCTADEDFTFSYVSDGYLKLIGYSEEEFTAAFDNKMENTVYIKDRKRIKAEFKEQLKQGNAIEIEYRMVRSDGGIIWVLNKGQLVMDENGIMLFCVLVDITTAKLAKEELILSEERHRIIVNQTEDVIFEWNFKNDDIYYSPNLLRKFGYEYEENSEQDSGIVSMDLLRSNSIHEDDKQAFKDLMSRVSSGSSYEQAEVRIKKASNDYIWCIIRVTAILDENGYPIKAIGVIIDIDKQKKETQNLLTKAQTDTLTGLYNKGTTEFLIEEYLQGEGKVKDNALFVIDIDNFKYVNDNLGHLFGDAVLSEISAKLKKLFRTTDIVGRIGGDEFVILLKDVRSTKLILEKADALTNLFRQSFTGQNKEHKILGSIGISMCPKDGDNYIELFKKADTALYYSKNHGKDCYWVYCDSMESDRYLNDAEYIRADDFEIDSPEQGEPLDRQLKENISEYIVKVLYESNDFVTATNLALNIAGRFYGVSRAYVFENSEDDQYLSNTFEWCNENITPQKDNLQNIPYIELGNYKANFNSQGIFYCNDTSVLNPNLHKRFEPQGTISFLQYAILDEDKFSGFVGFAQCYENRLWTQEEIDTLSLISKIVGTFLLKNHTHQKMQKTSEVVTGVLRSLDTWVYAVDTDTYEFLYIDEKKFKLAQDVRIGDDCDSVFNFLDISGEDSPAKKLEKINDCKSWDRYFAEAGRWFNVAITRINWVEDREAFLISFTDITKYKKGFEEDNEED